MPRFSIAVEVDCVDDLDSAWLALIAARLEPRLSPILEPPDRDQGSILVSVHAETAASAEGQVRNALEVLEPDTFRVGETAY